VYNGCLPGLLRTWYPCNISREPESSIILLSRKQRDPTINNSWSDLMNAVLTPWSKRCTSWSGVLLEKLPGFQLVKKFPAIYGTRRLITAFTSFCQLSLFWASSIQTIHPHPTSWRSVLVLSCHLRLCLPSGLFPSGFPTKTLYTLLLSPVRATLPVYIIFLCFTCITRTILGEEYRSFSSSQCSFLHSPMNAAHKCSFCQLVAVSFCCIMDLKLWKYFT
jgi:hypothetical protein